MILSCYCDGAKFTHILWPTCFDSHRKSQTNRTLSILYSDFNRTHSSNFHRVCGMLIKTFNKLMDRRKHFRGKDDLKMSTRMKITWLQGINRLSLSPVVRNDWWFFSCSCVVSNKLMNFHDET